jgi:nitroreductase
VESSTEEECQMTDFAATIVPDNRALPTSHAPADDRARAVEAAADSARLAPSVHNTQPWRIDLQPDGMRMRADRSRQLTAMDPQGRALALSIGAALFNARVALAARGFGTTVERVPDPHDADLLAVIRLEPGPDAALAALLPSRAVAPIGERSPTCPCRTT